jgi:8-oxo-dGTP pyrophosphatase MutT (NUDIX family)
MTYRNPNPNRYAGLLIHDGQGRVVAVHHSQKKEHQWRFPGGKIRPNEMPIIAAAREAAEEVGIIPQELKLEIIYNAEIDGKVWQGYYFKVGLFAGALHLPELDKHDDWGYFTYEEIQSLDSHMWEVLKEIPKNGQARTDLPSSGHPTPLLP